MDDKVKSLINQIKANPVKLHGDRIRKVILYGSYVRGEVSKDSDIDVLVLV
jgi:predicted nucleotidyltransferase